MALDFDVVKISVKIEGNCRHKSITYRHVFLEVLVMNTFNMFFT